MSRSTLHLCLRPENPTDQVFLAILFASTRADELASLAGSPAAREAFLRIQLMAQKRWYDATYPAAERSIVLLGGTPAGRLIVNRSGTDIVLVDVAFLPEHRGSGAGTALLTALLAEAARARRRVKLHVAKTNPAARLYRRLGFVRTAETGMHDAMEWRPAPRDRMVTAEQDWPFRRAG